MSARFRIRTSQGQEISFASHEMFAEFVRSGELSPDDVVYDAETREWSSALTHPVVLQIETETEEAEAKAADEAVGPEASEVRESTGGDDEEAAPASSPEDDIGLELAPAPSQLTPEEESAAFVKKLEAERASERDFDDDDSEMQGFKMEQGSSGLVEGMGLVEEEAPPAPTRPPPPPERPGREEAAREWEARDVPVRKTPTRKEKKPPKRKRKPGALKKYAPLLIVGAVIVGAGIYFGPELMESATEEGTASGQDSEALPPPPEPLIPDTEDALRERAQERFLATTRALLRDLPPIPNAWLSGSYLAAPSDYPEVREAWNEVLATIRQVRAGDNERYRAGYVRALDDARVDPSTRTLRVAAAVADFQGRVEARAAHYDRIEALAMAALRAHDALVEAEGTIVYEPAVGTPVSGDPVIEAVGRNPQAQDFLDQVLDMILAELNEPNGPGSAENLGEWIWDGILDAVAL